VTGGSFALGRWRVHRAGYGAMQLAGDGIFGPPGDRDEALRVLRAAVAAGVDHIDTAQFYGAGTVNELIREALYPYPDDLAIVSKVAARHDTTGALLRQGVEDNPATLGADRLAAVNLRMMDPSETPGRRFDAQLAALVQAREEGLIDGIGPSNVSRRHLLRGRPDGDRVRARRRRPSGACLPGVAGPGLGDQHGRQRVRASVRTEATSRYASRSSTARHHPQEAWAVRRAPRGRPVRDLDRDRTGHDQGERHYRHPLG
jgi:Aldo/keto reductase family